jgi:hypothetical protein
MSTKDKVFRFQAILEKDDKITGAGIPVPFDVQEAFGTRGHIPVKGTVNGIPFRSSLSPMGRGRHYLLLRKEVKEQAGIEFGDAVRVELEYDAEPRDIEPPRDFAAALAKNMRAMARWQTMSYSRKLAVVGQIDDAKQPETRARRVARMVKMLETEQKAKLKQNDKPKPGQDLAQKLRIKKGRSICFVNPPEGYIAQLGNLPDGTVVVPDLTKSVDIIQVFVADREELENRLPKLKPNVAPNGIIWVTYHKGTSKVKTDINRDGIWQYARTLGMEGVAMISLDDSWSAMRLKVVE